MDNYDAELAARVWQRVRGEPPAEAGPGNLRFLIAAEEAAAAAYSRLLRRMPGKAALLRRMAEDSRRHGTWLRGICRLTGEGIPGRVPQKPRQETAVSALRKCYGQNLKTAGEYDARADDPEYGHAFAAMAEKKREHCRLILELLGELQQPGRK